jgi:hypothetical protein
VSKLLKGLRPNTKTAHGKVGPCERCAYPDCEYVSVNMQLCPKCDYGADDIDSDFDLDMDTDPGFGPAMPAVTRWYHCQSCPTQTKANPYDVAAGQRCTCGGMLYVKP